MRSAVFGELEGLVILVIPMRLVILMRLVIPMSEAVAHIHVARGCYG